MESDIITIAGILDSSEKIEEKLHILDVCYDIIETIRDGSRPGDEEQNALVIQKIIEGVVNSAESETEPVDAETFIRALYKCLYKLEIVIKKDALYRLKIIERGYDKKIKSSTYIEVIDSYDELDTLEKCCLSVVYKEYYAYLADGAFELFGPRKASEIMDEFSSKSIGKLYDSLDDAVVDDEMTVQQLVDNIHYNFSKLGKDIYLNKYKNGELDLRESSLASLCGNTSKKDSIPIFISDIYERTLFINEKTADKEFVEDCCDLLNISEEKYREEYLLPGKVTHLQLTRLLRMMNNKKEE